MRLLSKGSSRTSGLTARLIGPSHPTATQPDKFWAGGVDQRAADPRLAARLPAARDHELFISRRHRLGVRPQRRDAQRALNKFCRALSDPAPSTRFLQRPRCVIRALARGQFFSIWGARGSGTPPGCLRHRGPHLLTYRNPRSSTSAHLGRREDLCTRRVETVPQLCIRFQRDFVTRGFNPDEQGCSLNDLVGTGEKRRWHGEPKRPRGLQVDDQLDPGRRHHR